MGAAQEKDLRRKKAAGEKKKGIGPPSALQSTRHNRHRESTEVAARLSKGLVVAIDNGRREGRCGDGAWW